MKLHYNVSGGFKHHSNGHWFCALKVQHQWMNFVTCKTWPHAIAQFKRLPVRDRQIDMRGRGKPRCVMYGRFRRQK